MQTGKPFRCQNCDRLLIEKIHGNDYKISLHCPRCKASIYIVMKESIPPWAKEHKEKQEIIKYMYNISEQEKKELLS